MRSDHVDDAMNPLSGVTPPKNNALPTSISPRVNGAWPTDPLHRSDAILRFAFEPVVIVSFMAITGVWMKYPAPVGLVRSKILRRVHRFPMGIDSS